MTGERAPAGQSGFSLLALLLLLAGLGVGMAALGTVWHTAAQRQKEAATAVHRQPVPAGDRELLEPVARSRQAPAEEAGRAAGRSALPQHHAAPAPGLPRPDDARRRVGAGQGARRRHLGRLQTFRRQTFQECRFFDGQAQFQEAKSYRDWVFRFDYAKALKDAQAKEAPTANHQALQHQLLLPGGVLLLQLQLWLRLLLHLAGHVPSNALLLRCGVGVVWSFRDRQLAAQ